MTIVCFIKFIKKIKNCIVNYDEIIYSELIKVSFCQTIFQFFYKSIYFALTYIWIIASC
mgnify:CR=1 FL=1